LMWGGVCSSAPTSVSEGLRGRRHSGTELGFKFPREPQPARAIPRHSATIPYLLAYESTLLCVCVSILIYIYIYIYQIKTNKKKKGLVYYLAVCVSISHQFRFLCGQCRIK
jgi:ABC-type multidrug transport system permease subunit